jgi:hypothetical protein
VIASSAYYDALVQGFTQSGQMTASQAQSAAHCIQDGLTRLGFKTQGDAEGPNTKKALTVLIPCARQAQGQ